jgi:hypothetical protein
VATIVVIAAMAVALVEAAGNGISFWAPAVSLILAGGAIAGQRWVINRAGLVIDRSR